MRWLDNLKDAVRRKKSRDFSRELANQFFLSPMCSDYENLFAQIRPMVNEMKVVMPYAVTDRGARVPEARAMELAWLKNPNDEMGWAEFADLMFASWLTEDELDIHVWKDDRDNVIGYTIIPPQCRIYLGYGRWIWQVMTTDGMETLEEDQVMRLRFSRSPRDVQRGVSPASAVRVWAQIDDLIAQYQRAYFENGAIPATITFITASTFEKYDKTRKELENKLKGARNRNKTVYAWRQYDNDTGQSVDQVEVKTIQGNNSTLAIREIVDIVNDRLNKSVGVSNFILGDDSSAKYDNAELTRQQFIMNRVYPALISFWNQFEHELDRITGGLGYHITFDLDIPELTERQKAKAEIGRIRGEALVNLISAGASGDAAVEALELPDAWLSAARGIYNKGLVGELNSPVAIDYTATTPAEATVDEVKSDPKAQVADVIHGHNCTCHHSLDKLPAMTPEEKVLYDELMALADKIMKQEKYNIDEVIEKMMDILADDALAGSKEGMKALALLADEDVANEITTTLNNGEYYISESLKERISTRANQLVKGYADYTQEIVEKTLAGAEDLTANQIAERLAEVMPREKAELIARNETLYAIRSGRLEQDETLAEKYGLHVQLVWRTSGDADVCPICKAMEGTTIDLGKAFPDTVETEDGLMTWEHSSWNDSGRIPDAHVNCVLGDTIVGADNVKLVTKMKYSGEVVKLKTRSGEVLSVTPNHVLLTDRGWVCAKNIKDTDKVVAYCDRVKDSMSDNTVDGNHPTIADEFMALEKTSGVATVEMPVTTKDFKGDGIADEKVQIILPQSFLRNKANTSLGEFPSYLPFVGGKFADGSLFGYSSIDQLLVGALLATNGIMGRACESLSLLGSGGSHADIHRLTSVTAYNTRIEQALSDSSTADIKSLGKSFLADSGIIEFDDIVDVEIYSVHDTPVYDLETTSTLYTANGIISSNCRCYFDERLI